MKNTIEKKSPFQVFRDKIGISNSKFFGKLQTIGKAMVFPIIVLPLAALFLRFGNLMTDTSIHGITEKSGIWYFGQILQSIGQPAFSNLPIVFAIGLAFGLTKEQRGEAALAGAIAAWVLQSLLGENTLSSLFYSNAMIYHSKGADDPLNAINNMSLLLYTVKNNAPSWGLDIGVLGGIVAGSTTAFLYNKYHTIKLPMALSFFEGRRFICIIAVLAMVPFGIFFSAVWPWIQIALTKLGTVLVTLGYFGTFVHTLLKSLLVLFGLHQILNTFLWFQLPITGEALFTNKDFIAGQTYTVNGDINAFLAGINGAGLFQTGSFTEIMGGYWGISLAIIFAAKKENRKKTAGLMLAICSVCSLTGVGEPLILPIWYASPLIYVIQCVLNAIFGTIPAAMGIRAGFGFSAGWVDYCISFWTSWKMAALNAHSVLANPLWLIPLAAITGGAYFGIFYTVIKAKNIETIGREEETLELIENDEKDNLKNQNMTKEEILAIKLLEIIKPDNVVSVSNCATRLRLEVHDNTEIDQNKIKSLGIYGIKKIGTTNVQIIIGSGVELVTNYFEKYYKESVKGAK